MLKETLMVSYIKLLLRNQVVLINAKKGFNVAKSGGLVSGSDCDFRGHNFVLQFL